MPMRSWRALRFPRRTAERSDAAREGRALGITLQSAVDLASPAHQDRIANSRGNTCDKTPARTPFGPAPALPERVNSFGRRRANVLPARPAHSLRAVSAKGRKQKAGR